MTPEPTAIGTLLEQAYSYAGFGLEIFPVAPTKRPLASQMEATTDLDQIQAWWSRWSAALIGHRISPYHVLLDIDPRHGGKATWAALKAEMPAFATRTHLSGRGDGGGHVWFQRPADKLTQTKLDAWAKERGLGVDVKGRWTSGIDLLRHEHRYTILPPSPHPDTGEPYLWKPGQGLNIEPTSMPALLAELITADELPPVPAESGPRFVDPTSIADWYSDTHGFAELLGEAGWTLVAGDGDSDGSRWRHPEATTAVSATVRHGCLFVYSTSTPFEPTGPGEVHGYTPFRAYATLQHGGDLASAGSSARKERDGRFGVKADVTPNRPDDGGRHVGVTWASNIGLRRVRWCWDGRLAQGTLGLLAGPEGLGKSTVAATIGAKLTRGTLPSEFKGEPRPVLVAATEDSWAHTIAPRFLAAGADLGMVGRIEVKTSHGLTLPIEFPTDEDQFADFISEVRPALVIFDPLISRLNRKLDSHRDGEVRQALEPLVAIAEAAGVSLLGLIHHNKTGKTDPLDLVMASKAFTAVARSVHTVIRDPDDETGARRYFGTAKNNLGSIDLPTRPFVIEPFEYDTVDGERGTTGRIQWGDDSAERIDAILRRAARAEGEARKTDTPRGRATDWILNHLAAAGGSAPANKVIKAAENDKHARATLYRARDELIAEGRLDEIHGLWKLTSKENETETLRQESQISISHSPHARAGAHARDAVTEDDL